jgi:hypothetical protein
MADENKPAFYPRVGNIKAKNFKPAQPMPFVDDERAMDLPQYGDVDLSVPSKENLELSRRMAERDAQLRRQREADRSPLEKLAGGVQAGRFLGSALTQGINSIPTRLFKGDEAADKFMQERIYKPEQPLAYEYAGDVGDFLEKLETEYKIPPLMPEALPLQFLSSPATSQAMKAAGRGAEQAGMAIERGMEPVVKGALERGGLPREMVMAMGANTQSNVVKPYGGNWLGGGDQLGLPENDLRRLKAYSSPPVKREAELLAEIEEATQLGYEGYLNAATADLRRLKENQAVDKWIDSNLTNYVKKEMGTRDDPVRKLAEEGIIHTPLRDDLDRAGYLEDIRKAEGYPAEGMGKSELAKRWENLSDDAIRVTKAGAIQDQANIGAKLEKARAELDAYKKQIDENFIDLLKDKGGLSDKDRKVFDMMPTVQKAEILGERQKLRELQGNVNDLLARESGFEKRAGELNPFVSKLDPQTRLYSGSTYNLGFDHIVDVLKEDLANGRIRPEQLNKVSMEQAVRRTYEYDQEMAKRMREAAIKQTEGFPTYKEYPEGFRWIEIAPPKELPQGYSAILDDVTSSYKVVDENGKEAFPRKPNNLGHINVPYFKTAEEAIADALQRDPRLENALKYEGDTMGHCVGGYCQDVRDGNTKIYSLRDAKGEPHVTVEVRPKKYDNYALPVDEWFKSQPEAVKNAINESGYKGYNVRYSPQYKEAVAAMPPDIIQIKGKGNAKPKDEYIPFVQDFVKTGNWSQVGDFRNTGLRLSEDAIGAEAMQALKAQGVEIPKYVTQEEAIKMSADAMSKAGTIPPPAGMKRGGKVSISNNPDTMMLEVNNQKMKNGVPAYAGGKLIVGKGLKAAKPPKVEVPRIAMQFGNDLELNMNEVENLARRYPSVDRINMNYKDVTKRVPELTEAAQKLQAGELDRETYAKLVQALKPVKPYDFVPKPATADEARGALKEDARDTYGIPSQTLAAGHPVGLRLDIPAYTNKGVWVPTVHEQDSGFGAGKKIGHESVASVLNPEFGMSEKAALSIATGKPKGTIATIKGDWNPTSEADIIAKAKEYLKHPEWRQIGMDPERHSYFYDRETMAPVINAEEVIQIGPLVLAKNPKFGKPEDFKYAKGGITGAINLGLKAARPVVSDAERALPLRLTRAMPKSKAEINAHAERVARQMMGEHVTSGKAGDTKNLAGRSMKESQRVKGLEYEIVPTKDVPESQVYQPQIGDINMALPGDFTLSDVELKSLQGEPVGSRQQGGSRYGLGHMEAETPLFYASNEVPAQGVQNKATDLSDLFGAERIIGQHMAMGPVATNFAQHFADANLRYTDYSKLRPQDMYEFDKIISEGFVTSKKDKKTGETIYKIVDFPDWPGVADPQSALAAMEKNPEMRKWYNRVMQTPKITEPLGFPSGQDVRYAITSPDLRDMEVNLTGHGVGQLVPGAPLTDTAQHATYSKGIPGMYLGHQEVLTPFAISFPDAAQHIITTKNPQDFTGTIQKVFPHQRVDQQFMDEMDQYRRRIKELTGKKKGGVVKKAEGGYLKKPAAYINGDEFVNAAKKYGIKDSMNNLNKIVDLVNKGLSVDDAARQVADSGMHKAAGGAIRGDDLILEERPL